MDIKVILDERLNLMYYPVGKYMDMNYSLIEIMSYYINSMFPKGANLCCSGSSGAIIAGIIAYDLMKEGAKSNICHVKKKGENSHCDGYNYIDINLPIVIVDDFISSGETVNRIYNRLSYPDIDLLIVTGNVIQQSLVFKPKTVVCLNYRNLK